ncbi:MAG: hypothetical protein IIZ13_09810 [Renibacterium sp.]|nr:hypothetical protein [Renibacterium sp.]
MKSPRVLICATVAAAALFALAGCSGSSADPAPSSLETAGTPSPASPTASATPAKAYTAEQLSAVIPTIVDSTGTPYTRVPTELLDQGLAALKTQMASMQVAPAECRDLALQNSNLPEGSILATGNSAADKSALTVLSAQDPAVLTKYLADVESGSKTCSNFTVIAGGQEIKAAVTALDVKTSAAKSTASLVVQTLPTGNTVSILAVTGVEDNVLVTAAATGVVLQASDSPGLVRVVDEYFAKLDS